MNTSVPSSSDQPVPATHPGLETAIDFINTTGISKGRPFEEFVTVDEALDWLVGAGYLDAVTAARERSRLASDPARAAAALRRVATVRAGLRELIDALAEARTPRPSAIHAVNGALRIRESVQLVADGARVRMAVRRDGQPLDQALASLARAVAEEISEGRPDRFRICENDRCRWAFYDRSRPGTRRWCEMSSCGNQMKAARHRARHRAEGNPPAER